MALKKIYELTQEGVDNLSIELKELKEVKRPANLEALKEARAQGDLSENADFDAARNEQAQIEGRIRELEVILKNYKLIEVKDDDLVGLGKTVILYFVEKNSRRELKLVGGVETNPAQGKISIDSPIGKAINGKTVGDEVQVKSDTNKVFHVRILEIILNNA